jgi:type I protein arginine methyltransferase
MPESALLGQFIPLHYHYHMLTDESRMAPFAEAIALVVRPGMRVVDLGAGTGVLSFFAARAGAKVVWSIEANPELAAAARVNLDRNGVGDRVHVIDGDAATYVPPEPVEVVICEMLHTGLLREKQIDVLRGFKRHYLAAHGAPLPRFVPEGYVQAVQPVEQDWTYAGYSAEFAHFQHPSVEQTRTVELADPAVYDSRLYEGELPDVIRWDGVSTAKRPGRLNAIRLVTRNLVAIVESEGRSVDWLNSYMIVPLAEALDVAKGDRVRIAFSYRPGAQLDALVPTVAPAPN